MLMTGFVELEAIRRDEEFVPKAWRLAWGTGRAPRQLLLN